MTPPPSFDSISSMPSLATIQSINSAAGFDSMVSTNSEHQQQQEQQRPVVWTLPRIPLDPSLDHTTPGETHAGKSVDVLSPLLAPSKPKRQRWGGAPTFVATTSSATNNDGIPKMAARRLSGCHYENDNDCHQASMTTNALVDVAPGFKQPRRRSSLLVESLSLEVPAASQASFEDYHHEEVVLAPFQRLAPLREDGPHDDNNAQTMPPQRGLARKPAVVRASGNDSVPMLATRRISSSPPEKTTAAADSMLIMPQRKISSSTEGSSPMNLKTTTMTRVMGSRKEIPNRAL